MNRNEDKEVMPTDLKTKHSRFYSSKIVDPSGEVKYIKTSLKYSPRMYALPKNYSEVEHRIDNVRAVKKHRNLKNFQQE